MVRCTNNVDLRSLSGPMQDRAKTTQLPLLTSVFSRILNWGVWSLRGGVGGERISTHWQHLSGAGVCGS